MTTISLSKANELDVTVDFPTKWNELESAEVLHTAKALISSESPEKVRANILMWMIAARAKAQGKKLPKKWQEMIDPESFFIDGNQLLDFLFTRNDLTQPPEPVIRLSGLIPYTVHGPEKGFDSITCSEYEHAIIQYQKFLISQSAEDLAMIAAILWRPRNTKYAVVSNGEIEFYKAEKWAPMFRKLEPHRLYSIFIWFTGCMHLLPKRFPVMHEPDGESDGKPDLLAFTKCIHAGAGERNGTRDKIRIMNLMEFMFDMEQQAVSAKKSLEKNE